MISHLQGSLSFWYLILGRWRFTTTQSNHPSDDEKVLAGVRAPGPVVVLR